MKAERRRKTSRSTPPVPNHAPHDPRRTEEIRGSRRGVRKRRRRTRVPSTAKLRIARNESLEVLSCEQRSTRIVHALLQAAALLAALGVAFLSYTGYRSGSEGAWVGVLGSLMLFAVALFSLKKMREPSDWDQSHLRPKGERERARRRSDDHRAAISAAPPGAD